MKLRSLAGTQNGGVRDFKIMFLWECFSFYYELRQHRRWFCLLKDQATLAYIVLVDFKTVSFAMLCCSISKSSCRPSQNLAEFPKYLLRRNTVSAVILRLPLIISDTLVCGISTSWLVCMQ